MAISFVNSGKAITGAAVTTFSLTYSPAFGNMVVVTAMFTNTVTTPVCTDNNGNQLTMVPSSTGRSWEWYAIAGNGVTSYTINWTTSSPCSIIALEYSGALGIGANNANGATSTTPGVAMTTTAANSFVVAMNGVAVTSITFTQSAGTLRTQEASGAAVSSAGIDNTSALATATLTCSTTIASSNAWRAMAVELLPTGNLTAGYSPAWLGKQVSTGINKH